MKKLIITAICAATAVSGFSQGSIQFANAIGTRFYFNSTSAVSNVITSAAFNTQPAAVGASIASQSTGVLDVGVLWGTSATSLVNFGGFERLDPANAGQILGSTTFLLSGTVAGNTYFIDDVAWDSTYGDNMAGITASIAAGSWFGSFGSTGYGLVGTGLSFALGPTGGPGQQVWGTLAGQVGKTTVLSLAPGPEPSTLAIGGLGAAALLLFRRRK